MSLWLLRFDKSGKSNWVAAGIPIPAIFVVLLLTSAIVSVALAATNYSVWVFLLPLLGGFGLFLAAKLSVMRRVSLLSFGSKAMTPRMRSLYHTGYVLMILSTLMILSFVLLGG
ncbi:MAG: hypothetical protein WC869_05070 [Phycisphaerae bacterium]